MKKDFYWAIGCSLFLMVMAHSGVTRRIVALRALTYYLIYPTTQTLLSAFRYAGFLSGSWRETLAARYYWDQLQREQMRQNLEALDSLVLKRQEELINELQYQEDYLKTHSTIFGASAYPVVITQRMLGEQSWSSLACSSHLPGEVQESAPAYQLLSDHSIFVLAGHLISDQESQPRQSCYEFITSPRHRISVSVGDSGEIALLRGLGRPDRMILEYLPKQSPVRPGAEIHTSASSSLYPPGIPVGVVDEVIEPLVTEMFARAYVRPYLDLGRLETLVVIPWPSQSFQGTSAP
ncbi:MAG: rod shape-determining protein MreC [Elusimicrobia bacterium]|nr:rod shape-determining protein MreC [Elusimicrobiota bacterium]